MSNVFISYSHTDQSYINDIKGVRINPNHMLGFKDMSLSDPIFNEYGHVNRRSPYDDYSAPVRKEIEALLRNSDKLLVLIGNDTHSKQWIEWEISVFKRLHGNRNILVMRTPNNYRGGTPPILHSELVRDWDLNYVANWVGR